MKDLVEILPDHAEKVGNMSVTLQAVRDAESAGYAHYMSKALAASEAQREENRKLAEIRKKRYGIDPTAQQPSTLAIMARPKEDDEKHWNRHLPPGVQFLDKDGNVDVAAREVTPQEVMIEESRRHSSKNTTGQSEKSGSGEQKKEAAVHAFIYSPPAALSEEEKQRAVQWKRYDPITAHPFEEEIKRSIGSRILHWLWKRGVPVDKFTKKELSIEEADKDV